MTDKQLIVKEVNKVRPIGMVGGVDISKLIKSAQDSYGKKEVGLARQIATGGTLSRPSED
jgi:hypothetical protein